MFDIYSLAKPRVFKALPGDGGSGIPTPSETPAPDSVEVESLVLANNVRIVHPDSEAASMFPDAIGRIGASTTGFLSKNIIDAFSDLGGAVNGISNMPGNANVEGTALYRTEFRPKSGLHNLDFSTPSETPSDNPGGDAPAQ